MGKKPYVISEIGINHAGRMDTAKWMIRRSKDVGADAVKFQAFDRRQLENRGFSGQTIEALLKSAVTEKNVGELRDYARKTGIDFGVTAFSEEAVDVIRDYAQFIKTRCADGDKLYGGMTGLVEKSIMTGKPVVISVSMDPPFKQKGVEWMNCVSKYPCSLEDINLDNVRACQGFSNHCDNPEVFDLIKDCDLRHLEIHVTLDKKNETYLDNPVSYTLEELKRIIHTVKR